MPAIMRVIARPKYQLPEAGVPLRNARSLPVNQDWLGTAAAPPHRTSYGLPDMLLLVAASSIKDSVLVTRPFFCS